MSSILRGIATNEIVAKYDLVLSRSKEGLWTATQTYYCKYVDYGNTAITDKLRKGTPITTLFNDIPIQYNFISLESHNISHQKGGITEIRCSFSGADDSDGWGSFDNDRSVSYSYRGVLGRAPIIEHPNYLRDVPDAGDRRAIASLWSESATTQDLFDEEDYTIERKKDGADLGTYTDPVVTKWITKIVSGVKFYDKPQLEWTVNESNKGGMTQAELDSFGRVEIEPDGSPLVPSWADPNNAEAVTHGWWHFSSITEDKDENSSSYARTYTLRDDVYDADLYGPAT
tara:strand:- start:3677 stop:4534 length:858 start_codon:yes stop_codon:yes gene_type:complete